MRKKCHGLIILAVIICVVVNYQVAYSADVLSSVCTSYGDQDALVAGKVVNIDSEKEVMNVEIFRLLSGNLKYKDNTITIEYKKLKKIGIGDKVLLSLEAANEEDSLYKIAYECGCYSIEYRDDKKLKLLNNIYTNTISDDDYFDISLQWFCNTGEILYEEDLIDNTKYYRQDGENTELVYDQNKHKWYQDSFSSSFEVPDVMKEKKEFTFKVIIIVFAVCVGSVLLCYFLRRKYISKKDKNTLYAKND